MRTRWLRPGTAGVVGLILVGAIGCSQQEPLEPDPGVSPFYPGPTAGSPVPGSTGAAGPAPNLTGSASAGHQRTDPARGRRASGHDRLRPDKKGDSARADALLERVLEVEPINREALLGLRKIALEQSRRATLPAERAAALEKAGSFIRSVRRAYEQSNKRELAIFASVLYEEVKLNAREGRLDRAVAVLKEAYDAGFDAFERVEHDDDLAKLRSSPGYRAVLQEHRFGEPRQVAQPGQELSRPSSRLRLRLQRQGPRRQAPLATPVQGEGRGGRHLGHLVRAVPQGHPGAGPALLPHRRRGLEIIGLDYEQNAPDPETARKYVKQVVQQMNIPYRIAMGDEVLLAKIPDFHAYPTTLLIDRAGRVRMLVTENAEGVLGALTTASRSCWPCRRARGCADPRQARNDTRRQKGCDQAEMRASQGCGGWHVRGSPLQARNAIGETGRAIFLPLWACRARLFRGVYEPSYPGYSKGMSTTSHPIKIGTSGWSYPEWDGAFYPAGMDPSDYLSWYADRFPIVEVDSTFYRVPVRRMVLGWRDHTPPGFRFALKVPQIITHKKQLQDCEREVRRLHQGHRAPGREAEMRLASVGLFQSGSIRVAGRLPGRPRSVPGVVAARGAPLRWRLAIRGGSVRSWPRCCAAQDRADLDRAEVDAPAVRDHGTARRGDGAALLLPPDRQPGSSGEADDDVQPDRAR